MNRRWFISRPNPDYVRYVSQAASISPVLAHILINRNIKTAGAVKDFLYPRITALSDPFELPGVRTAVERIKSALRQGERVLIHGDYDTDGLTATALLASALKTIGLDTRFFIPTRKAHGYGFNPAALDLAAGLGVGLIITVDCGISSFSAVSQAAARGIDVIITDHHEPVVSQHAPVIDSATQESQQPTGYTLPEALAVINPKLLGHDTPLKNLSGAGVAFKLVQALAMEGSLPLTMDDALSLLDLAALGTVADVVPLIGENRIILSEGLRYLNTPHRSGIRSLKEVSGITRREMRAGLLSFTMVPRINAMGRMGDAAEVVSLFLSDDDDTTMALAERLDRTNTERQRIEEETYQQALHQLKEKGYDRVVVLSDREWHEGVIGIVAARLVEELCRPVFVFSVHGDIAKGSGRSIPALDLYQALSQCSEMLLSFGGHRQAAGVRLKVADLGRFEHAMNAFIMTSLSPEDLIPTLEIDVESPLSRLSLALVNELSMLEPFGYGNPDPLFGAKALEVLNPKVVGNNHLKMKLKQRSWSIDTIGFDMGGFLDHLAELRSIDAAFLPTAQEWNGASRVQLNLKAFRPNRLQ